MSESRLDIFSCERVPPEEKPVATDKFVTHKEHPSGISLWAWQKWEWSLNFLTGFEEQTPEIF